MDSYKQQLPLILAVSIAMITMFQVGILTGWSSPVLANLQAENSTIPVSSDEGSWIATIQPLTGIFITPFVGMSLKYLGRKRTILISNIPFLIFWIMVSFATTSTELIIARGFAGISLGLTYITISVYLGEISPDNIRGGIGIGISVVKCIGILWIYWIGTYPDLWISSLVSAIPIIFVFLFYKWLPESPYYLVETNRKEKAREIIKLLKNTEKDENEITKIESTIRTYSKTNAFKEILTERCHQRALFICLGTYTFAQFTGGITLMFYSHLIFQKAGDVSVNTMSMIKAFLQVVTAIGAAFFVDKVGRKPLLIISCIGSALFMFCEGIYFYLYDNGHNVDLIWWLPVVAMILFDICQIIGLQSISIAYLGELFHPKIKPIAVCIGQSYFFFSVFTVGKLFQIISDGLGNYVPFFIFAGIGIIGVFFVIFCVPETKGKSLEEIQYYMKYKTFQKIYVTNQCDILLK